MSRAFDLGPRRRARRPSLTPMIDVVFLLLVFFMLAARFGAETALGVATGGAHGDWEGPPRLVEIDAEGVRLNGVRLPRASLAAALSPLMPTADSPVVLRAVSGAEVSDLADVLGRLHAAGIGSVVVVE